MQFAPQSGGLSVLRTVNPANAHAENDRDTAARSVARPPERAISFQHVKEFIQQHLGDPDLSPKTIAATHHISIRTLHRLFAGHGLTVATWIRASRLEHCRRDLIEPSPHIQPINVIGRRWGFTTASHFTRAFRAAYGITPTECQQGRHR